MKLVNRILVGLHIFVGVGAVPAGLLTIINPNNPLGMPNETLKNSPFTNYLIPGIILFSIIGLGNLTSAFLFRFKSRYQGYISSVFSWALVIWIVVQCIMLQLVAFPHVLYFIIGLIQAALSFLILFENQMFPANIVVKLYKNIKDEKEKIRG